MRLGILLTNSELVDGLGVINSFHKTAKEVFQLTGNNLGNIAFKYASTLLVNDPALYVSYKDDPEVIKKKIDILLIPEANLLNSGIDYSRPAEFVKKLNIPCFMFGVGAQANSIGDDISIPQGTIDFMTEVAERSICIFTRGDYSSDILHKLGVKNTYAVGCPSILINPSRHLWQKVVVNARSVKSLDNSVVTEGIYQLSDYNDFLYKLERQLFSLVYNGYSDYVTQANMTVIKYALNKLDELDSMELGFLKKRLSPMMSLSKFESVAKDKFKAFYRIDSWLNFFKNKSFIIGTRAHGNILALQVEVPILPIAHDSRTVELFDTMAIPFLSKSSLPEIIDSYDILEMLGIYEKIDYKELDYRRSEIAQFYLNTLESLKVNPSNHIKHLSEV